MATYEASNPWGARRSATLLAVAGAHGAVLAWLLAGSPAQDSFTSRDAALEFVLIAPVAMPKVHTQYLRRADFSAHGAISAMAAAPSANDGLGPPSIKPGSDGSTVDWTAEAHRALKAYEIRRDRPPSNVIAGATRDEWWPQRGHHAGERYKTENGDWIVWIDSSCYQIASWRSADPAASAALPHTVCLKDSAANEAERGQTPQ